MSTVADIKEGPGGGGWHAVTPRQRRVGMSPERHAQCEGARGRGMATRRCAS